MALTVEKLKRTFNFNGVDLPDPGLEYTPEEVKDVYSAQYPDLSTAVISEPIVKNDALEYTFVRNVGTKG